MADYDLWIRLGLASDLAVVDRPLVGYRAQAMRIHRACVGLWRPARVLAHPCPGRRTVARDSTAPRPRAESAPSAVLADGGGELDRSTEASGSAE